MLTLIPQIVIGTSLMYKRAPEPKDEFQALLLNFLRDADKHTR